MWSTNLHEPLITGKKKFDIVPDGRRYAIDLVSGTIAEGDEGDLVTWIKRPESVRLGERYDWSCEMVAPRGGLLEEKDFAMFTAPEGGYTNVFAHNQEATGTNGWGFGTGDKRFYIKVRNGQIVRSHHDQRGRT